MAQEFPYIKREGSTIDTAAAGAGATAAGAENAVRNTLDQASQKAAEVRDRVQEGFRSAKNTVADAQVIATEKARLAAQATETYVKENPWVAVGVASAVGLLLGMLIKRR